MGVLIEGLHGAHLGGGLAHVQEAGSHRRPVLLDLVVLLLVLGGVDEDVGGGLVVGAPEELGEQVIVVFYLELALLYLLFGLLDVVLSRGETHL